MLVIIKLATILLWNQCLFKQTYFIKNALIISNISLLSLISDLWQSPRCPQASSATNDRKRRKFQPDNPLYRKLNIHILYKMRKKFSLLGVLFYHYLLSVTNDWQPKNLIKLEMSTFAWISKICELGLLIP